MKVSDSGEAFFVLETESDGGLGDPDFLDLSGNVRKADAHRNDGYVSAPGAHETDSASNSNDDDEDLLHRLGDGPLIAGRPQSSTLSAATTENAFVYSQNKEAKHRSNNVVPAQRPMSVVSNSEFITKGNTTERKPAADWDWGVKLESVQPHHQHRHLKRSPFSSLLSLLHKMPPARLLPERLELSLCGIEPLQQQTVEDTDEKKAIFDNAQVAFGGPEPSASNKYEDGNDSKELEDGKSRWWWYWSGCNGNGNSNVNVNDIGSSAQDAMSDTEKPPSPVNGTFGYMSDDGFVSHPVQTEHENEHGHEQKLARNMHYAKALRLTSDQLKSLELRRGANDVKFLVASNNVYCKARISMRQYDTQIVISDIDGTITKPDALGHLFNMVGKDWAHMGVAKLHLDIVSNGYKVIYLTARAIG
ncbi:lipin Ned1 [Coemansia sp. RSA 986]|nr:lipin Ned1 [Coemansia sp. RSA 1843]KAJ2085710.1 lipin Ned1 [Coemansia sp. RSA 986]